MLYREGQSAETAEGKGKVHARAPEKVTHTRDGRGQRKAFCKM